jgi:flagellar biogenesis protein FliO
MNQGDGMKTLHNAKSCELNLTAVSQIQGFAGWVIALLRGWRGQCEMQRKQLRVVETLQLGGKKQLMLVTCGGESFLVGSGSDSVQTLVRLNAESSVGALVKGRDGLCQ